MNDAAYNLLDIAVALAAAGQTRAAILVARASCDMLGFDWPSEDEFIGFGRDLGIVPPCPR